jgi:hypothetical protein
VIRLSEDDLESYVPEPARLLLAAE